MQIEKCKLQIANWTGIRIQIGREQRHFIVVRFIFDIPMQFRLSTLFLIIFNVAASLALFAPLGIWFIAIWVIVVILLAAFCLNQAEKLKAGIKQAAVIFFFGIIFPWFLSPLYSHASPDMYRRACMHNLKQIGDVLHEYHKVHECLPVVYKCDEKGKPLFSWRVEILPMFDYGNLYNSLKMDEPWNSTHNAGILSGFWWELFCCQSGIYTKNMTDYVAVIGPGTAWRENGAIRLSDLPDGGSHTVMAVEIVNSDINWAEPRDLTVDEALEGLKTGKGLHIGSNHANLINMLFADTSVHSVPSNMDISEWKKLFSGEEKDIASIEYMPPHEPEGPIIFLAFVIWMISVVLLFRRAVKSRRKAENDA